MVSALVFIDVQQGMFTHAQPLYRGEEIVVRLATLLRQARDQNVPVFHIRHEGGAGHGLEKNSSGWFHHAAVAPQAGETIIDKRQSSAFHGTDFHNALQKAGVDHLIVGGMQTQMCVESTVRGAVALGYRVTLVEDAHTTYDTPVLSAAQIIAHHNDIWGGRFATLVKAEQIRFKNA
jgi:nicotinamidase-related amidase